jgi:hypothetical protein
MRVSPPEFFFNFDVFEIVVAFKESVMRKKIKHINLILLNDLEHQNKLIIPIMYLLENYNTIHLRI